MFRKLTLLALVAMIAQSGNATDKMMSMNFKNKEVQEIVEAYGKASGQKFILDPDVRGKISIVTPQPVDLDEAFHLLSSALQVRSYAIVKRDGFLLVRNARTAAKDNLETSEQLPTDTKPERLFTWVIKLQFLKAEDFEKNMRSLITRDGDFFADPRMNQLVVTDFISNLQHIKAVVQATDKKAN